MDSLVSTDWLQSSLGAGDLEVLDANWHLPKAARDARAEHRAAHIPGARFLDLDALREPGSGVGATLPGAERAAQVFSSLGLRRESRIVLYDDSAVRSAARAWYILHGYGFARVAILDGGLAKWRAEGRALQSGAAVSAETRLDSAAFSGAVRDKAQMLANLVNRGEQVVDARDAARFTGAAADTVHDLPGGHIPGARHLFFRDLYAEDGTLRPDDELRAAFAGAGLDLDRPVTASCGSGVTASSVLFALHKLGHEGALYDGSWGEWGADPATPKETGPAA